MKKRILKSTSLLLASLLVIGLAGCGGASTETGGTTAAAVTTAAQGASTDAPKAEGLPKDGIKYSPAVELTTVRPLGDDAKFKNGENVNDNVFTRWMTDKLGINVKLLWTTPTLNDAFKTKLMLTMASNEPLPDFISLPGTVAQEMIDSGKFQDAGALFDKYASPEWKKAMNEVPDAWLPYIRDGVRYAIPQIDYIMMHDDAMWIRQDWLEKLGLSAPKNIEELEKVMDAFVNQDPDGNKVKDTYGLATTMASNYNSWIGPGALFGANGAIPQKWQKNENGEIVYGSIRPEIKTTLGMLKNWVEKGYLHKEVGMHDEGKAYALFTSGKAGIAFGPTWLYDWPLNEVEKNVPGAKVWPYALPVGPDGKLMQASEGSHYSVLLFNKDFKNPEIFFTYMNYLFDNFNNPVAGGEYEYGNFKGYDYDMVDGKPVYGDQVPGGYVDTQKYYISLPPRTPSMFTKTLADLANGKVAETPYEKKLATGSTKQVMEASKIVVSQHEFTIDDLFTGVPTKTMNDKLANLKKMENEEFSKILYGKIPLDEGFDKFVKDWNASGGEKITQEVREWYQSVGGK